MKAGADVQLREVVESLAKLNTSPRAFMWPVTSAGSCVGIEEKEGNVQKKIWPLRIFSCTKCTGWRPLQASILRTGGWTDSIELSAKR
jgi:hypothetical protein